MREVEEDAGVLLKRHIIVTVTHRGKSRASRLVTMVINVVTMATNVVADQVRGL